MVIALLLPLIALGPGHWLARPMRLGGCTHVVAAVGAGLLAMFVAGFGLFALRGDPKSYWGVTLACAACWARAWPMLAKLWQLRSVRRMAWGWAVVAGLGLLIVATERNISGGNWALDWYEHYERAVYFLGRYPDSHRFVETYLLPARPPMQNVLTAVAMSHDSTQPWATVPDFRTYQVATAMLSSLAYLPCGLIGRRWVRSRAARRAWWRLLAAVVVVTPFFQIEVLFPWTKMLCAFFVLLGVHLYFSRSGVGMARWVGVGAALGAAMLVHYSAAPFGLAVAGHALWTRRAELRGAAVAALAGAGVLGVWVAWSVGTFGWGGTFGSNTSVTDAQGKGVGGTAQVTTKNLWRTFVPHPLRETRGAFFAGGQMFRAGTPAPSFEQQSGLGAWRDYFFTMHGSTLTFAAGTAGLVLLPGIVWKGRRARFWGWFVGAGLVIGTASNMTPSHFGIGQVSYVPLALLAMTAVAARIPSLGLRARCGVVALFAFDALGVIWPHVVVSSRGFSVHAAGSAGMQFEPAAETLSTPAMFSVLLKLHEGLTFCGDSLADVRGFYLVVIAGALAWMVAMLGPTPPRRLLDGGRRR